MHELAHTRSPVLRPRFLLAGHDSAPDSDERDALDAGARAAQDGAHSAGIVDELPVGGGASSVAEIARRAVRAALSPAAALPAASAGGAGSSPGGRGHAADGGPATTLDAGTDGPTAVGAASAAGHPGAGPGGAATASGSVAAEASG